MAVEDKEQIESTAENEIQRLKDLEVKNGAIQKALQDQISKNQQNEQIFIRISAFLDEVLKSTARTTYLVTMAKDIIDSRNLTSSPS